VLTLIVIPAIYALVKGVAIGAPTLASGAGAVRHEGAR
jgi:hypothetical protein